VDVKEKGEGGKEETTVAAAAVAPVEDEKRAALMGRPWPLVSPAISMARPVKEGGKEAAAVSSVEGEKVNTPVGLSERAFGEGGKEEAVVAAEGEKGGK